MLALLSPRNKQYTADAGEGARTRMDHVGAMLQSDLDDLIAGKVGANRGILAALANDVGLIGLCKLVSESEFLDVADM